MHLDDRHRAQDIVADDALFGAAGHDQRAVIAEAAGLETVEGVDQVIVLARLNRLFLKQITRQGLGISGDLRGPVHGQRRIHHAQFDGAEFGLGTDVPIKVLHALDDAGGDHLAVIGGKVVPVQHEGRAAAEREGKDRIESRRLETGVEALHERRRGGQGDKVRYVATEGVQQPQRLVRAGASDMDMLAENGELLGQVAIELRKVVEARGIEDGLLSPVLKWVSAAPGEQDAEAVRLMHQGVANTAQLAQGIVVVQTNVG